MSVYDPSRPYMTISQAATSLGVQPQTVRNAVNEERLPCVRVYGRVLIDPDELEVYRKRTQPDGEKPRGRPRKSTP